MKKISELIESIGNNLLDQPELVEELFPIVDNLAKAFVPLLERLTEASLPLAKMLAKVYAGMFAALIAEKFSRTEALDIIMSLTARRGR